MAVWCALAGFRLSDGLAVVGFHCLVAFPQQDFFPVLIRAKPCAPFACEPQVTPCPTDQPSSLQGTASGWAPARTRRTRAGCTWTLRRRGTICMSGSASSACWRARSGTGAAWPRSASARPRRPPSCTTPTTSAAWWPRSSKVTGDGQAELRVHGIHRTTGLEESLKIESSPAQHLTRPWH